MSGRKHFGRVKVVSLGNTAVGKTCIIKRYCERRFVSKYSPTIGIDFGTAKVKTRTEYLTMNLYDFSGHPLFYEVRNEFYKDAHVALLVYDVGNKQSFLALDAWLDEVHSHTVFTSELKRVIIAVCANKVDLAIQEVGTEEGRMWALNKAFPFFELSARSGKNVDMMFEVLLQGVACNSVCDPEVGASPSRLHGPKEQLDAIHQLCNGRDNFERLGVATGASRDEINKAYRKLAILLHPDKSDIPGTGEAFKILVNARADLLL